MVRRKEQTQGYQSLYWIAVGRSQRKLNWKQACAQFARVHANYINFGAENLAKSARPPPFNMIFKRKRRNVCVSACSFSFCVAKS